MTDPVNTADGLTARNGTPPPADGEPVEDRIRRLEAVIADLRAARPDEDAVAAKVVARLAADPPPGALAVPPGVFIDAAGAVNPPAPPLGAVLRPPELFEAVARGWWVAQAFAEFRLAARMYFDPRYRLSRLGQFVLPGALVLLVLNYLFFNWMFAIPIVGLILERLGCVLIAIVFYKLMLRELTRYRGVLDYMAKYGFR